MGWFARNAASIEAACAILTALIAVAALIGVKLQLDANAAQQAAQSARDIYRAQLAIAIDHPDFAAPDICALQNTAKFPAYEAFVDHLLYTSEQVLAAQPDWSSGVYDQLVPHAPYFCSVHDWDGYSPGTESLITVIQKTHCSAPPPVDPCE